MLNNKRKGQELHCDTNKKVKENEMKLILNEDKVELKFN